MKLSRKDFLRTALVAIGASELGTVATGCGSDDSGGSAGASNCPGDIVSNHGHKLTVTDADVKAGVDKTYSIQGLADHNHQVTVTKLHFADLKAGKLIALTSTTTAGHEHSITVQCG
jgi:hypothetical protein